jgi:DNA replication protein DnaC
MSRLYEEKAPYGLEQLGLSTALAHLDQVSQQAAAENWSYTHFLGYLLESEMDARYTRTVRLNLQFSKLPCAKRMADFDFSAQPSLDRRLIEELHTGRFFDEGRNIVFLGPPGVGKTHLSVSLGLMTAEKGHRIYFTTAVDLARKLTTAMAQNRLHKELNALTQPKLLILDEVGYLTFDAAQASLLFQVISRRYEKGQSIILTSNKPFGQWADVFAGDSIMASAALDRLLHRCTVINIRGESYRLKDRLQAGILQSEKLPGKEDMPAIKNKAK